MRARRQYDSTTEQNCIDPATKQEVTAVDLWNTTGPARHMNGTYEEKLFGDRCVLTQRMHVKVDLLWSL